MIWTMSKSRYMDSFLKFLTRMNLYICGTKNIFMLRRLLLFVMPGSMKNYLIVLFFLIFSFTSYAQNLEWARQFVGYGSNNGNPNDNEWANALAIDSEGNNYILGTSSSKTIDLDPTDGEQIIDNTNENDFPKTSMFLTKLDVNGNFLWGKTFVPESHLDEGVDIKIGTDGNLYILTTTHTHNADYTIVHKFITLIKTDLDGNILLTKKLAKSNATIQNNDFNASSFDLDDQNNIYIAGHFRGYIAFDLFNPEFELNSDNGDSFLAKMNLEGELIWTKGFGIAFTNYHFEEVKVNLDGSVNALISNGDNQQIDDYGYDLYKVNAANGETIWKKFFDNQYPTALGLDNFGNILIAGGGKNPSGPDIDVDPSGNLHLIPPRQYLTILTSDGNFVEVKKYQNESIYNLLQFNDIEVDTNNNIYLIGLFEYSFDADPSENAFMLHYLFGCGASAGSFCIKLDSDRNFVDAFNFELSNEGCPILYLTDIKIFNESYNFTGAFSGTIDADPSSNSHILTTSVDLDGCIIKINPCTLDAPNGNPDQYFCSLENATVQNLLPNSSSIEWNDSLTGGNLLVSTTPLVDGVVYYASRIMGSCTGTPLRLAVTAHISASPVAPVVTNEVFCESNSATLSSLTVSGQDLKWYDSLNGVVQLNINTVLVDGTTYYVSQTVNACESNRIPMIASVVTTAFPVANATAFFCKQENKTLADLTITGQDIKWYDAPTGGNLLDDTTLLDDDTYYALQTINGCESGRIPVTVTIQHTTHPIGFAVQYFCDTQNLTLADLVVTGTDVVFYDSQFGGNILPMNTPLVDDIGFWASQTVNGCESTLRLPVVPDSYSDLPANDYAMSVCDDLNDGKEKVDLSDYNENIIGGSNAYSFNYYTDYNSAENQIATDEITDFSDYELEIGMNTIYVRIGNNTPCYKVVMLQLNVIAAPVLNMLDTYGICEGGSKTITADPGFYTYTWSTGELSQSIRVTEPGTYSVTVTEYHGDVICGTTKNITVVASNRATITSIVTADWTAEENMLTVFVDGLGNYEYSLDGEHYQPGNQFTGLPNGEYMVYVNDINGCGVAKDDVYLLMYPKFFTPNADGYNDSWGIKFYKNEPNMIVKIFDRHGKFIKQLTDTDPVWDGTHNGQLQLATDYWFIVIRENGKEHKGHFTLKR